jgi:hypothetical protein
MVMIMMMIMIVIKSDTDSYYYIDDIDDTYGDRYSYFDYNCYYCRYYGDTIYL